MRNKTGHFNKKVLLGVLAVAIVMLAVFVIAGFFEKKDTAKAAEQNSVSGAKETGEKEKLLAAFDAKWSDDNTLYLEDALYGYDHRIESYLFIGTDNSGDSSAAEGTYHGGMADFLLLMVIDHTDNTCGFLQIDRNMVTDVPVMDASGEILETSEEQICCAHWYGGNPVQSAENTVDAVKTAIGELEHIDGYYVLNMEQIGRLNASVGGVEVTFDEDLTSVDAAFKKGATLTLTDEQAEAFIRARMNTGDDRNELRMNRQRQYMNGFLTKAKDKVMAHPNFANTLWDTLKDAAVTDMSGNDFSRIAESFRADESKGILAFDGNSKEGTLIQDGEVHEEFYADAASVTEVMTELFSLIYLEDAYNELTLS